MEIKRSGSQSTWMENVSDEQYQSTYRVEPATA